MAYSYIVHVVAVVQVEVAYEVTAVVLWITVRCRHTRTHRGCTLTSFDTGHGSHEKLLYSLM